MKEIWKDIKDYKGLYQVSNLGNVRSLNYRKTGETKVLKQTKQSNGYFRVGLCKDGEQKTLFVHRLVAETFISNPNNYPEVNHKDENKTNNNINNLEWCTSEYNSNYGTRIERITKARQIPIYCVELHRTFDSSVQAGIELNLMPTNIIQCCKGKQYTTGGFHFRYAE